MNAQDIIRSVLDLIDKINNDQESSYIPPSLDDSTRRFDQISDILNNDNIVLYANEPQPSCEDLPLVTTDAGGGINGPKNPSDMRGDHTSMYPFFQFLGK